MRVEVTQDDIDNGKRMDGAYCPIALALRRLTGKRCSVSAYRAGINYAFGPDHFHLPKEAQQFVLDFDDDRPVVPLSFELNEPYACEVAA
jgi:hypothetical protein